LAQAILALSLGVQASKKKFSFNAELDFQWLTT